MGNCMVLDEETKRDRELTRELKRDYKQAANVAKLLLLGTGESGKSTIVKQMKIIHGTQDSDKEGLTEEERKNQVVTIKNNILDSIEALLTAADDFGYKYNEQEAKEAKTFVTATLESPDRASNYTPELAKHIALLWNNPTTQECVKRKNEFQVTNWDFRHNPKFSVSFSTLHPTFSSRQRSSPHQTTYLLMRTFFEREALQLELLRFHLRCC